MLSARLLCHVVRPFSMCMPSCSPRVPQRRCHPARRLMKRPASCLAATGVPAAVRRPASSTTHGPCKKHKAVKADMPASSTTPCPGKKKKADTPELSTAHGPRKQKLADTPATRPTKGPRKKKKADMCKRECGRHARAKLGGSIKRTFLIQEWYFMNTLRAFHQGPTGRRTVLPRHKLPNKENCVADGRFCLPPLRQLKG